MSIQLASFLVESDRLSLSTDLAIKNLQLIDRPTGARHVLHPLAARTLTCLKRAPRADDFYEHCYSRGMQADQINDMLTFLYKIGGLTIQRSLSGRLKTALMYLGWMRYGILMPTSPKRFPADLAGVCFATWFAMRPVGTALIGISLLLYGINIPAATILAVVCFFFASLFISVVVHELGHCKVILKYSGHAGVVIQRGMCLGVLHSRLPDGQEVTCAIAGPLCGLVSTALLVLGGEVSLHLQALAVVGCLVGSIHLLSLLPFFSDGQAIWRRLSGAETIQ